MKTRFLILCIITYSGYAQVKNTNYFIKDSNFMKFPTGIVIHIGGSLTNFQGSNTGAFNIGFQTDISKHLFIGISCTGYSVKNVPYPTSIEVVNPRFGMSTFTLDHEYLFLKDKKISISLFNKIGMAYAVYDDKYKQKSYYTGKSTIYQQKIIANQVYLYDEPGMSVNFNLFENLSLSTGASYRFITGGSNKFGSPQNFNGWNYTLNLKLKIPKE